MLPDIHRKLKFRTNGGDGESCCPAPRGQGKCAGLFDSAASGCADLAARRMYSFRANQLGCSITRDLLARSRRYRKMYSRPLASHGI